MGNKKELFYVRIDFVDLLDFATDDDGKNMSLLQFAKELKKEKSSYPKIQRIINEAHCYISQKKDAGKKSAQKRAELAAEKKRLLEEIEALKNSNGIATDVNGVERRSNDVATDVNGDRTNNRNNNRTTLTTTIQEKNCISKRSIVVSLDEKKVYEDTGEEVTPFDPGYTEDPEEAL